MAVKREPSLTRLLLALTMALLIGSMIYAGYIHGEEAWASVEGCTTDTDCMEKHGGDGGPKPR